MSKELLILKNATAPHVHARGGNQTEKGDIGSETEAALAGGFSTILAMPNTDPPITNREVLSANIEEAKELANCIVGFYIGATDANSQSIYEETSDLACALKIYMDNTTGQLKINSDKELEKHFKNWKGPNPICVHAEEEFGSLKKALMLTARFGTKLHVCHVSSIEEVVLIREAKEMGLPVTCEVTPHHLLLTEDDLKDLKGYGVVKPRLKTKMDVDYLWDAVRMGIIDVIADDHAPHTKKEKESADPPSGIPGLETTIPLMLTAVQEKRITIERLIEMICINPRRIFNLPNEPETYTAIDLGNTYYLNESELKTRCGYSPFKGHKMTGKVREVCIRGYTAYVDGKVYPHPERKTLVIQKYNGKN